MFGLLNIIWFLNFLTTSLLNTSLNCFMYTRKVFNLPTSKSSSFAYKLFKPVGTLTNL